jgi:ferredoxin
MLRNIISIDREKCDACGLCASACHEGAISIQDGKATLQAAYCDGLGNCLPACPAGAITITQAEAPAFIPPPEHRLSHWPLQIRLAPARYPALEHAALLIAADCAAYAYGPFQREFMQGKVTLIGCPKLDNTDYPEKLAGLIKENQITSLTAARMEVPCCGGIERALTEALKMSGKDLPLTVVTLSVDGRVLERR